MLKLSEAQAKLLHALVNGYTLKSHRYLDGTKIYQLHPLDGPAAPVQKSRVDSLQKQGLITSNQKFPVATYSLTEQGRELAARLEKAARLYLTKSNCA
jgi:hypothetical protein